MSGLEASLLLGAVHGIALAFALLRRRRHRQANRYLAALLATLALLLFDGFLRARGVLSTHPHLIGLTAWVPFVIGPLVFLYVREMTAPDPSRLSRPHKHFLVPALYVLLLAVTFFPRSAAYKRAVAERDAEWFITALEVGLLVYGIAYAVAALVLLRRHRANVQALYSNLHGVSLRWLVVLASLNAIVWIAALVAFVIRMTGVPEAGFASLIVPIGSTITVFVVGYFQLGQAEIFVPAAGAVAELAPPPADTPPPQITAPPAATPPPQITEPPAAEPPASVPARPAGEESPAPAYARARLDDEDAAALEARIKAAMTEKRLYQRAGLTLAELADEVAATPHEVSQVLSTRLGRNFYTFVNEHRIEHVKAGLRASDRSVLDLAFEAGFQSKSTFNTAFRKATGTTPREFRQQPSA